MRPNWQLTPTEFAALPSPTYRASLQPILILICATLVMFTSQVREEVHTHGCVVFTNRSQHVYVCIEAVFSYVISNAIFGTVCVIHFISFHMKRLLHPIFLHVSVLISLVLLDTLSLN